MKLLEEAEVSLNFKELSNYKESDKVLTDPKKLLKEDNTIDKTKIEKMDEAVSHLLKVLNISQITAASYNIMEVEEGGLPETDLAYCFLELARLYILRAVVIAADVSNNLGAHLGEDGKYYFEKVTKEKIKENEEKALADIIYLLIGKKISRNGKKIEPNEDIKNTYILYEFDGFKGALALALKFVDLAKIALSSDIADALDKVRTYINEYKDDVEYNIVIRWGFKIEGSW